tara:strand:+ start:646 stop:1545 length:900 start_codon:yes stop_codon:yes gene_type:complete
MSEQSLYLQEKFFSYGTSLAFILILSAQGVADAYLILGHAHFMMTALYKYKRGRIDVKKFAFYLASFAVIYSIAHRYPGHFTIFVSAYLLVHVFTGEVRHLKLKFSAPYFLLTLGMILLLCAWLTRELFGPIVNPHQLLPLLTLMLIIAVVLFLREQGGLIFEKLFFTMTVVYCFFLLLELIYVRPKSYESFGFIVIAHYLTTYFNVFLSFRNRDSQQARKFVLESLGMNLLFLSGYILVFHVIGMNNLLYDYFYHPISFYVWTLMHFLTTMDFTHYGEKIQRQYRKLAAVKTTGSQMP